MASKGTFFAVFDAFVGLIHSFDWKYVICIQVLSVLAGGLQDSPILSSISTLPISG